MDATGRYGNQDPASFVSLFSATPGKLTKEVENLRDEEFACGRNKTLDFVTFTVNYGCWSSKDCNNGWSKLEIPELLVESDSMPDVRKTRVLIDTKQATRWSLAVNREEISDFTFEGEKYDINNHICWFSCWAA